MLTPDVDTELRRISGLYAIDADTLQEIHVTEMTDELLMDLIELLDATIETGVDPTQTDLYKELEYRTSPTRETKGEDRKVIGEYLIPAHVEARIIAERRALERG